MYYWHVYVFPLGYIPYDLAHRTEFVRAHRTEFVTSHNERKESFQQSFYNRYKIVVYTGLRSVSIKNHASRNEARRIAATRIIFTRIGCTLLMCDMYMSDLKHIHDPVLSSLKMEGIRLLFYLHKYNFGIHPIDASVLMVLLRSYKQVIWIYFKSLKHSGYYRIFTNCLT
jgi:hypothetical protein